MPSGVPWRENPGACQCLLKVVIDISKSVTLRNIGLGLAVFLHLIDSKRGILSKGWCLSTVFRSFAVMSMRM